MADKKQEFPYQSLGSTLRVMREKLRESLAEVSGAVEIDIDALTAIEQGISRPSEDILLLLISHFGAKEDEATKLWELAGYDQADTGIRNFATDLNGEVKNSVVVMPLDARISYTDMAHVMVNNHGVVLNFLQTAGPGNQPLVVSRLGMSREHAQSIIELLQKTLSEQAQDQEPKALPAPENTENRPKS